VSVFPAPLPGALAGDGVISLLIFVFLKQVQVQGHANAVPIREADCEFGSLRFLYQIEISKYLF
jgi:hypothetical protein